MENSLNSEREKNKEMKDKIDALQGEISVKIQQNEQIQANLDTKNKELEEFKQSSKSQLEQVIL